MKSSIHLLIGVKLYYKFEWGMIMRIYDLAYLAVRVLAVWLFISAVNQVITLFNVTVPIYTQTFDLQERYMELILLVVAPALLILIGSIVLWKMAGRLAGALIPADANKTEADSDVNHAVRRDLEGFVLSVVGLILFIVSFTSFLRLGAISFYYWDGEFYQVRNSNMASFIAAGIRSLIGIVLLVKAEGFAILLRKIRSIGMRK